MEGAAKGGVKTTTILDRPVALVTTDSLVYAAYKSDTTIIVAMTPTLDSSKAIVTALLAASE